MPDYIHPELRNIAADLDEDELGEIASECIEDYEEDLESRQEWDQMHGEWLKLYFQKDKPKAPPWEGSSEESLPLLVEACVQFSSRAYQAMFPNRNFLKALPTGNVDDHSKDRAKRVSKHLSWQLLQKDRRYKKNKDRLLLSLPLHGSFFTKTYYDPLKARNVTRNVRAVDLVVPYGTGPRDLEDLDRKTEVIHISVERTKRLAAKGYFLEEAEPYEGGEKTGQDEAHDAATGHQDPAYQTKNARLIEQHRLLDLDKDGLAEPYIVVVDLQAEKVLRIAIRYDTDEAGMPTNDKEPVECYTHYVFFENPDGFYGLGYGHLIGKTNAAVNKILRQTLDAGTLANVGNHSGFISEQLNVKKGELQMQLGKYVAVPGSLEDFKKGFHQFSYPGADATQVAMMEKLLMRSDRLATTTEALTGQTEKVMQPNTINQLVEQGLQVFSGAQERVIDAWGMELEKHYRLNFKHLDPQEYFAVQDLDGTLEEFEVARDDYKPDLQIIPVADPKMATEQQKIAKAQIEYETLMMNPLVQRDPNRIYTVTRRFLEAIGVDNIQEVLPRPIEGQVPRNDDPHVENMGALSPIPVIPPVHPDQDHQAHLHAHYGLLIDLEYGMKLTEAGRRALEDHNQAHLAMMYGRSESGQVGASPLGSSPGNGGLPEGAPGEVQPQQLEDGGIVGPAETTPGAI